MTNNRSTSFSKSISGTRSPLPERYQKLERLRRPFDTARTTDKLQSQGSAMIKQDKPHPAPRPSSALAKETDRSAFQQKLKADDEAARKRAFIQARKRQAAAQRYSLTQTYNQKRGTTYDRSI